MAWVLCDEVYRGTDQAGGGYTASIADLYEKGIGTAGMSKAYSLAGLRVGWIVAPTEVIEAVMIHRDYNTISVGQLDEYFAALALENLGQILARAYRITRDNLAILDALGCQGALPVGLPCKSQRRPPDAIAGACLGGIDEAALAGCPALVRVRVGDYSEASRLLDFGAAGIVAR